MSLLDSDRFYGKFRRGAHKVDVTDLMRMVKEDMLKFDRSPFFPSASPAPSQFSRRTRRQAED